MLNLENLIELRNIILTENLLNSITQHYQTFNLETELKALLTDIQFQIHKDRTAFRQYLERAK